MNVPPHCSALLAAKARSELTFAQLAEKISKPEVWTTALFFGQAHADEATAKAIIAPRGIEASINYGPDDKNMSVQHISSGLTGKGGVDGMVTRGGTWEWPPKVGIKDMIIWLICRILSFTVCMKFWWFMVGRTKL